jgi:hypothetical protein
MKMPLFQIFSEIFRGMILCARNMILEEGGGSWGKFCQGVSSFQRREIWDPHVGLFLFPGHAPPSGIRILFSWVGRAEIPLEDHIKEMGRKRGIDG